MHADPTDTKWSPSVSLVPFWIRFLFSWLIFRISSSGINKFALLNEFLAKQNQVDDSYSSIQMLATGKVSLVISSVIMQ